MRVFPRVFGFVESVFASLKVKSDTPYSAPRVYEEIAISDSMPLTCWHLVSMPKQGSGQLGIHAAHL